MKIAVLLSGCGYLDGAEVRESVLSLLYLDQQGADVSMFAPDVRQRHVINHRTGESASEDRNVLDEAARIARGDVAPASQLNVNAYDALVLPGGFGVAKNFSDFAMKGTNATIHPEIEATIQGFYRAGKPIGAICIAPAIVAAALQDHNIELTIGEDENCAGAIAEFGNNHTYAATDDAIIDRSNRIASCSAYMRDDAKIADVATGIEKVITAVVEMVKETKRQAA